MLKLAVLSDIHSAAGAYAAALAEARSEGFDMLVLLGDLLTYGPFPEQTVEITANAMARHETVLIEGNHDQIYLERSDGGERPHASGWIGESIDWTSTKADLEEFARLEWRHEFILDGLLLAHANPYGFGDWSYLRTPDELRLAAECLASRGLTHGIFGHSHRHARLKSGQATATTIGSVGQPRSGSDKCPQWAMVTLGSGVIDVALHRFDFDWRAHCEAIRSTSLSDSTKERLCEFFL